MNTATPSDPYCHRPVQRSTAHARGRLTLALCLVTLALLNACTGGSKDDREQTLASIRSDLKHADELQRSDLDSAILIQRSAIDCMPDDTPDSLRIFALTRLGISYSMKDELDRADSCYEVATSMAKSYPTLLINLLINQGINQDRRGKSDVALALYDQAYALARQATPPDEVTMLRLENNRAVSYNRKTQYDSAMICLQRALQLAEKQGDQNSIANAYMNMGNTRVRMEDYETADSLFRMAKGIYIALGNVRMQIKIEINRIISLTNIGRYDEALAISYAAEHLADSIGDKYSLGSLYNNRGKIYFEQKKYPQSLDLTHLSLNVKRQIGDTVGIIASLNSAASAHIEMGQYDEAIRESKEALKLTEEVGIFVYLTDTYDNLSKACVRAGDYKTAFENLEKQHTLRESLFKKERKAAEIGTRYETEKHELEQRNIRITLQKTRIFFLSLLLLLSLSMGFFLYVQRANRRRLRQEISIARQDEKVEQLTEQTLNPKCSNVEAEQEELGLSEEKINELLRALRHCMEEKQMYKEKDLRIETVANEIGTNRTYLSGLLNNRVNKNFTDYVNFYRIKEAKRLLRETDDIVKKIALEVGFGSYQTFNYVFGKAVRLTPGEYRKAMRKTDKDKS